MVTAALTNEIEARKKNINEKNKKFNLIFDFIISLDSNI
jgi:hypothetical protein